MCACRQLWARNMGQRVEIEAVYSPDADISAQGRDDDPETEQIPQHDNGI